MPKQPFNRLKDCRHGRMLYNINDRYIGRSLDLYGEFSEGEVALFQTLVRPGDVVIEVGANIGTHTVWFAKTVGERGAVIAFEPQRIVFQTLCANIALNSLPNVLAVQQACGETDGAIMVPMLDPFATNNFGGLELENAPAGEPVGLARVDDMAMPHCRLLKVDVEGMELAVLKGSRDLIQRCQPILYVENDRKEKSDDLIRFIDSLGYRLHWHRPALFNPENFLGNAQDVFPNIVSLNMLCLPPAAPESALERISVPPPP